MFFDTKGSHDMSHKRMQFLDDHPAEPKSTNLSERRRARKKAVSITQSLDGPARRNSISGIVPSPPVESTKQPNGI